MPAHHAQRFAAGVNERSVAQRDLLAFNGRDQAGVILDHVRAGDDIHRERFRNRLAGVASFERGEFVVALAQNLDRAAQNARTRHRRHRRPHLLPAGRAGHRTIDVFSAGGLDFSQNFAVRRVNGVEGFSSGAVYIGAMNIELLQAKTGHRISLS